MKLIILAAGKGSRFNSKKLIHKSFIKINNKTLMEHILLAFSKYQKIIVVGYNRNKIKKNLRKFKKTKFVVNTKFDQTEMLYSLVIALKKIKNEDVLITYSDIFYNYEKVLKIIKNKKNICIPILKNWKQVWSKRLKNYQSDLETLKVDKSNSLVEIGKKVSKLSEVMGQYMGLIFIPRKKIKIFLKNYNDQFWNKKQVTEFLNHLIYKKICKIKCLNYYDEWYEFDTLQQLKNYELEK